MSVLRCWNMEPISIFETTVECELYILSKDYGLQLILSTLAEFIWLKQLEGNIFNTLINRPELEDVQDDLGLTAFHDQISRHENQQLARQVGLSPRNSICHRDTWGATPLHWAASCANIEALSILLKSGADVNALCKRGRSVLHWALRSESPTCCQALIDNGADVNIQDADGLTVLMRCIHLVTKPEPIMDMLLKASADIDARDHKGTTPIMYATMRSMTGPFEMLLQRGARLDIRDYAGRTALFHAVDFNHHFALALLINLGVSLSAVDKRGFSIVHYAAAFSDVKTMNILQRARIDGLSMDKVAVASYFTSFAYRDKCVLCVRATPEEESAAFHGLLSSVIPDRLGPPSNARFSMPGTFPSDLPEEKT
jgi:ankyrin repeat protein